jgi:hypothetical protein
MFSLLGDSFFFVCLVMTEQFSLELSEDLRLTYFYFCKACI